MPAPENNQFWKLRSKHGRNAIFTDPEKLWEAAIEYFEYVDQNPILEHDYVGKDAVSVYREKKRPYTIAGLSIFLGVNSGYFSQFKGSETYLSNKDFSEVYARIEDTIYSQKFEGASVGIFNHNIIARDLGLSEKKEIDLKTPEIIVNSEKTKEEIKKLKK